MALAQVIFVLSFAAVPVKKGSRLTPVKSLLCSESGSVRSRLRWRPAGYQRQRPHRIQSLLSVTFAQTARGSVRSGFRMFPMGIAAHNDCERRASTLHCSTTRKIEAAAFERSPSIDQQAERSGLGPGLRVGLLLGGLRPWIEIRSIHKEIVGFRIEPHGLGSKFRFHNLNRA